MKCFPTARANRFNKLAPGELFFFAHGDSRFTALKVMDEGNDSDAMLALLGPDNTQQTPLGLLLEWQAMTVVSLGSDFEVQMPTVPNGWSIEKPPESVFPLLLADGQLYFRAVDNRVFNRQSTPYIRLSDGMVVRKHIPGITAYATRWDIVSRDEQGLAHKIAEFC